MACQTCELRAGMSEEAMALKCTGMIILVPGETLKADPMPGVWS